MTTQHNNNTIVKTTPRRRLKSAILTGSSNRVKHYNVRSNKKNNVQIVSYFKSLIAINPTAVQVVVSKIKHES